MASIFSDVTACLSSICVAATKIPVVRYFIKKRRLGLQFWMFKSIQLTSVSGNCLMNGSTTYGIPVEERMTL
jgi:hypothetical protein